MARIRSIHPGFFTDEDLVSVSAHARLLFLGIGVEADDKGIFEWKPITLKMRLFPVDNVDIEALLSELEAVNAVRQFEIEGRKYGAIRNFRKFQRPKTPNDVHPITSELRTYVSLSDPTTEIEADKAPAFLPNVEMSPQMEEVGGNSKVRDKSLGQSPRAKRAADIDLEFENSFWPAYPRKVSKGQAEKAYRVARKEASLEMIMATVGRYAKERSGKDPKYTKHPSVWLNAKSWMDEPDGTRDRKPNGDLSHDFLFGRA